MTKEDDFELEPVKTYEIGRGEDLYIRPNIFQEIVYIDHKHKKKYPLKIRELGWAELGRIESEAQKITVVGNTPDMKFDNAKFRRLCFCAMVVEHPFPDKLEIAYIKLGTDFGNWFNQYIPQLGGTISEYEADLSNER